MYGFPEKLYATTVLKLIVNFKARGDSVAQKTDTLHAEQKIPFIRATYNINTFFDN